ncbi:C-reactive protein-like [Hyperolius riggenbachi]|uniref:C-reactive protein-like n=1 Tax=Hyperolius riggenbachi TaxID=752182 RepID=UPI0035A313B4
MEVCALLLLLLIPAPGSQAQQDLRNKVFLFPKESRSAHVVLRGNITEPLEQTTVCLWYYPDLSRSYTLFSLATPGKKDALTIFVQRPYFYYVYINQEMFKFKDPSISKGRAVTLDWTRVCVAWESQTGVVQFWRDYRPYPRKVAARGSSIASETSIVLGQRQESFGKISHFSPSFVGEIKDVFMWDSVFDIKYNPWNLTKVVDWGWLDYEIHGEVLTQPYIY